MGTHGTPSDPPSGTSGTPTGAPGTRSTPTGASGTRTSTSGTPTGAPGIPMGDAYVFMLERICTYVGTYVRTYHTYVRI